MFAALGVRGWEGILAGGCMKMQHDCSCLPYSPPPVFLVFSQTLWSMTSVESLFRWGEGEAAGMGCTMVQQDNSIYLLFACLTSDCNPDFNSSFDLGLTQFLHLSYCPTQTSPGSFSVPRPQLGCPWPGEEALLSKPPWANPCPCIPAMG